MIGVDVEWLFSQPEICHCVKIDEGHHLKSLPPTAFVFVLTFIRFPSLSEHLHTDISQIIYVLKQFNLSQDMRRRSQITFHMNSAVLSHCVRRCKVWGVAILKVEDKPLATCPYIHVVEKTIPNSTMIREMDQIGGKGSNRGKERTYESPYEMDKCSSQMKFLKNYQY